MPPDSPIEDVSHPPPPYAQDYPSPSSDPSPHPTPPVPPPPELIRSSFVFISSTSHVARESSIHCNRPTPSLAVPPTIHSSNGSTKSFSSDSDSSLHSSSGSSQLSTWWPPGFGRAGSCGGDAWKRSREYQTRLTAGECFEHAFSSAKKAREWEMVRTTTCNALVTSRSSSEILLQPQLYPPPVATNVVKRSPGGFFLGSDHEQRTKGCYVPPPKGSFISRPRLKDGRYPTGSRRLASPSSASSVLSPTSSASSSSVALSTLYSTTSGTSVAVREPLLSREEWEKASARRKQQRRKTRELSLSCNGSCGNWDPADTTLYANVEPISISGQYIGGWTGLELKLTKEIRRHLPLNRRNSSSQARHPFEDLRPRPPESPHSEDEHQEALHCATAAPVTDGAEEILTVDVYNENMTLTLWSEIFSQLASYFGGLAVKSGPLPGS